jgi:hypothetical protein
MAGSKEVLAHEAGLDGNSQDDRDMERLGKAQQFKVGCAWSSVGDGDGAFG